VESLEMIHGESLIKLSEVESLIRLGKVDN
jgi:hypothetical protein